MSSRSEFALPTPIEHGHACSVYSDSGQKQAQYGSYLQSGLLAGERCIFFSDTSSHSEIISVMCSDGFNLQPFIDSGAFKILPTTQTYLDGGAFERLKMVAFWEKLIEDARKGGFSRLRVAAEMSWVCATNIDIKALEEYEIYLNDLAACSNVVFLCMYDEERFSEDALQLMVYSHPAVVTEDAHLLKNPAYLTPSELKGPSSKIHLKALLATLTSFNQVADTKEKLKKVIVEQKRIHKQQRRLAREQKLAEIAAAEERQYKFIAESMPQIVWLGDAHGSIEYFNPYWSSYTGLTLEESLGAGWTKALHPQERKRLVSEWITFLEGGRAIDSEIRLRANDGSYRWHICRAVPVKDKRGKVLKWLGACVDINSQKELSAELASARDQALQSALLKSRFLANMSHEIRTPMNAVIGMCDVLLSTDLRPEQHHYANNIKEGAGSLLTVINDILDFSKIEAGHLTLSPVEFNLADTIENVVDLLSIMARAKGLLLFASIAPEMPLKLFGDSLRLRQIVINLVSNAIKFSNKGEIVVRASVEAVDSEAVSVLISVTDQGLGIAADDQALLFQPFAQTANTPGLRSIGTGLGLSICKGLVETMHGQIGLVSSPGVGSEFWFKVPFGVKAGTSLLESKDGELDILRNKSVLLVGRGTQESSTWRDYLEASGMKVECSSFDDCILQGRQLLQSRDLVLVDGERGYSETWHLAEQIREEFNLQSCKLVLVTPMDSPEVGVESAKVGFDAFVLKPLRLLPFLQTLATTVSQISASSCLPEPEQQVEPHREQRVLIVEDNSINRQVAKIFMSRLGFASEFACNGREALELCRTQDYDIILMDCEMPVMDGFEATREIRAVESALGRHARIVAMTGNAMEGDRENCLKAGMDEYLTKPLNFEDLQRVIKLILV
ncbi:MAG: MEDS domain-containing protein [Candidatus Melainabacteria bacterium]|nr:MEDS domain-containing protein [Candidatus Melainabacteria bacterium]